MNPLESLNPIAQGGIMIGAFGALVASLYKLIPYLVSEVKKRTITTICIPGNDDLFSFFTKWLASTEYNKKTRLINAKMCMEIDPMTGSRGVRYEIGTGAHYMFYDGSFCIINRSKEKPQGTGYDLKFYEEYVITMFTRNAEKAKRMVSDAVEFCLNTEREQTLIYSSTTFSEWKKVGESPLRSLDSVILDGKEKDKIIKDIDLFFVRKNWYDERGIPYRRGYLLHGPPGTGKTSLIKAIAAKNNMNIYAINMSAKMTEDTFIYLITNVPKKSIILLEDIDGIYEGRTKKEDTVSFKSFINAIDGVCSPVGSLIFMTTNHKEKLDPALIRPGRIDYTLYMGMCTEQQAIDMYKKLIGCETGLDSFLETFKQKEMTTAEVQQLILKDHEQI